MLMITTFRKIIHHTKLGKVSLIYIAIFCISAATISVISPETGGFGNALWLCFQTATTIGFGDTSTQNVAVRIVLVLVSMLSILYVALITGVFVSMCNEAIKVSNRESFSHFMNELENLNEKSPTELEDISRRIRNFRGK